MHVTHGIFYQSDWQANGYELIALVWVSSDFTAWAFVARNDIIQLQLYLKE